MGDNSLIYKLSIGDVLARYSDNTKHIVIECLAGGRSLYVLHDVNTGDRMAVQYFGNYELTEHIQISRELRLILDQQHTRFVETGYYERLLNSATDMIETWRKENKEFGYKVASLISDKISGVNRG